MALEAPNARVKHWFHGSVAHKDVAAVVSITAKNYRDAVAAFNSVTDGITSNPSWSWASNEVNNKKLFQCKEALNATLAKTNPLFRDAV